MAASLRKAACHLAPGSPLQDGLGHPAADKEREEVPVVQAGHQPGHTQIHVQGAFTEYQGRPWGSPDDQVQDPLAGPAGLQPHLHQVVSELEQGRPIPVEERSCIQTERVR